jgi:putative acyl-CoA dehydrogenase
MSRPSGIDDTSNVAPLYAGVDLFLSDRPLREAVAANGAGAPASIAALSAFGRHWGSAEMAQQARKANRNTPGLKDDIVEFDPTYHRFMRESMSAGLHAMTWQGDGSTAPPPAEVARAARFYMVAQVENGHMCPVTMTRASIAALASAPSLLARIMPKISSHSYDPRVLPWQQKTSITIGMGMTERQGGTDVRANVTRAVRTGEAYALNGHKWFMSAPMSDAFLVLAQAPGGLTCFFMPRLRPDGRINGLRFRTLKDKLGNRSNASSEVEFEDAQAWAVGGEGEGIRTILRMVQMTRLDCAISSAGIMRMALAQAIHNARYRSVFQKKLIDQPMMRAVLADMALEVEGAVAVVMRLCRAFDHACDMAESARARLLTPAVKYWVCKTAPALVYEAMECLGGNGYVEDSVLPRLYREAPVNAIWEGSGNVMALDVLRAFRRDDGRSVVEILAREACDVAGTTAASDIFEILDDPRAEGRARIAVERLAHLAATAALAAANPEVAEIFARNRLGLMRGATYGAVLMGETDVARLLERAMPPLS